MGKGVSCLGIGKRKVRGGLSVKKRREEREKEVGHSGGGGDVLELRKLRKIRKKRKRESGDLSLRVLGSLKRE